MPFLKNIGLKAKKGGVLSALSVTLSSIASGSSGYFTSSNGVLYTGASVTTPSNVTYQITASGGTQPYTIQWSSSVAYPAGYATADNQSSFTLPTYAGEQDQWSVKVIDSGTPTVTVSASIDTIVFGDDPPSLNVSTVGSDTPSFQSLEIYGSTAAPLGTIGAAIKYAIPNETTIYVAGGTYNENPLYSKYVIISGSSSPGLGSDNYFIYDSVWNTSTGSSVLSASRSVFGFTESSFNRIEVTPSGSIQRAVLDVSNNGVVTLQSGTYVITSSIRVNTYSTATNPKSLTIRGVHVPTGSGTSPYQYNPTTILEHGGFNQGITPPPIFIQQNGYGSSNTAKYISNVGIRVPYQTGSFFRIEQNIGTDGNFVLEMVKFYVVSGSVSYEMMTNFFSSLSTAQSLTTTGSIKELSIQGFATPTNGYLINYIADTNDGASFGGGRVITGKYSPFRTNRPISPQSLSSPYSFYETPEVGGLISGSRIQRAPLNFTSVRLQNVGTTATRPTFIPSNNTSDFNGNMSIRFDGVDEFLQVGRRSMSVNNIFFMSVFRPYSFPSGRGVVFKTGDHLQGISLAMSGSNGLMTLYSTSSIDATPISASLIFPVQTSSYYLVQLFLDTGSTSRRVGIVAYGTGSLITSSYFSSTQFPATSIADPAVVSFSNETVGFGGGGYRTLNYFRSASGGSDYFNGTLAMYYLDLAPHYSSTSEIKALHDWAWLKYLPSSSFVSSSLTTDNV